MHGKYKQMKGIMAGFVLFLSAGATKAGDREWRLVFEDAFERPELGGDWDIIQGHGQIVDGRLYIFSREQPNPVHAMITRGFADDVRLEFEAQVDPDKPACDIACGLGGNSFVGFGYLLQFGAWSNQVNQLSSPIKIKGVRQLDQHPPFLIEYGKTYRCVAVKEGRSVSYTVNGTRLLEVTDPDVIGGSGFEHVSVVTWMGMYVDNVKVYERTTPVPEGPTYIKDPRVLDIGYRWQDRRLSYAGEKRLSDAIKNGIDAYNRREYKKAYTQLAAIQPPSLESVVALAYVLGDPAYIHGEEDHEKIARLAREVADSNRNDPAAAAYALLADWAGKVTLANRDKYRCERIHAVGPEHNPFYYKNLLFRGRYHLAWGQEQHLERQKQEAMDIFVSLKKLWPDHEGIAQLTGEQIPWGEDLIRAESEGPAWARYLQEGLVRAHKIMDWWFTERQQPDGQLGGGWGDDVELMRSWGMYVCITSAGETALAGFQKLADGVWKHVLKEQGYSPEMGDIEHAVEPGADTHPLMLLLRYGDPEYVERNLKTAKVLYEVAMGVNERGGLQFKSNEFSATEANLKPWAANQSIFSCRAMRHFIWLAWYGVPEARDIYLRWADNLRDIAMAEIGSKPAGYMPFSMFWPSGGIDPPGGLHWLNPDAHYYGSMMNKLGKCLNKYHSALLGAYYFSGDRKYLEPIDRMMEMAAMLPGPKELDANLPRDDIRNLRADCTQQATPTVSTLYRWMTGTSVHDAYGLSAPLRFQNDQDLDRFMKTFEGAIASLRVNWSEKTVEVMQTDRSDIPGDFAIYGGYTGGVLNVLDDGLIPTMAVTWDSPDLNFAAVVCNSLPERLRLLIYNFNDGPTRVGFRPWRLVPGEYRLTCGATDGERLRPILWEEGRSLTYKCRGTPLYVDVPSRRTWLVDVRLLEKLDVPARRPDLAVHSRDVRFDGESVRVTLHNIGAAAAGAFDVVLEAQKGEQWNALARVPVDGLPEITNLEPVRREIVFRGAAAQARGRCRIVIDPEERIDESYELNNIAEVHR